MADAELVGAIYRLGRGSHTEYDAEVIADALSPLQGEGLEGLSDEEIELLSAGLDEIGDRWRDAPVEALAALQAKLSAALEARRGSSD